MELKKLGVRGHKWLRAFHIVFAGAWVGITLAALLLNLKAGAAIDSTALRANLASAQVIADLIPITSLGTIFTGFIACWLTSWGFFKYWSVVLQLAAAVLVILIAKIWLDPAGATLRTLADIRGLAAVEGADYAAALRTVLISASGNFGILVATSFVATVKPWGRTRKEKKEGVNPSQSPPFQVRGRHFAKGKGFRSGAM